MLLAQATLTVFTDAPAHVYKMFGFIHIQGGRGNCTTPDLHFNSGKNNCPRSSVSTPTGTKGIRRRQLQSPGREESTVTFSEQKYYLRLFVVSIP